MKNYIENEILREPLELLGEYVDWMERHFATTLNCDELLRDAIYKWIAKNAEEVLNTLQNCPIVFAKENGSIAKWDADEIERETMERIARTACNRMG